MHATLTCVVVARLKEGSVSYNPSGTNGRCQRISQDVCWGTMYMAPCSPYWGTVEIMLFLRVTCWTVKIMQSFRITRKTVEIMLFLRVTWGMLEIMLFFRIISGMLDIMLSISIHIYMCKHIPGLSSRRPHCLLRSSQLNMNRTINCT